jgi:hypothetical protein
MPAWIDLTAHNAALNVQQTQEGKVLILRSLSPQHAIPEGVADLGFVLHDGIFTRKNLRFTLQEIRRYFPSAVSRDMPMSAIFYVPAKTSDRVDFDRQNESSAVFLTPDDYGRSAFLDGKPVAPVLNVAFMSAYADKPAFADAMKSYIRAWHQENLKQNGAIASLPVTDAIVTARLPEVAPQRLPLYGINPQTEAARYALPTDFYEETTANGRTFFAPAEQYRTPAFAEADAALQSALRMDDQDGVKRYQSILDQEIRAVVIKARANMPAETLATAAIRVGDKIRFTHDPTAALRGRVINRDLEGTIVEKIRSSSGLPGFEVREEELDARGNSKIIRLWAADGRFDILPRASDEDAFTASREEAMIRGDNPHRIEALIQLTAAAHGHVMKGDWAERFTFNIQVPESLTALRGLMETHALPSLLEMRNTLKIDVLTQSEVPDVDYGKLVASQAEAIRGFKSSFAQHSQLRIDDLWAIDAGNPAVLTCLDHYEQALTEAESLLSRYEAKFAEQQSREDKARWEKFEPFMPGAPITKPAAAKIGFSKNWISQDHAWFQVRNGDQVAWSNGHIFDIDNPHYAGFSKFESQRYRDLTIAQRPDIARFLSVDTPILLEPVFVQRDAYKGHDAILLARPGGELIATDKLYYDYVVSKHPRAQFFVAEDWALVAGSASSIIHAKADGHVVAGVMPVSVPVAFTADQIREKIELYRPAPTAPASALPSEIPIPVLTWEFESNQRVGGRPAATAMIKAMEVEGRWYSSIDTMHHQGDHRGRLEPLTTRGDGFDDQFSAVFHAGNRIVREQRRISADSGDDVKVDLQRKAAKAMADWALRTILPEHLVSSIDVGHYQGWTQVVVIEGAHRGVIGIGSDELDALDDLCDRVAYRLAGDPANWRQIGVNRTGLPIEEDELGVRAYVDAGVRVAESVSVTPYGPRISVARRSLDYLTRDELRELRKETAQADEPSPVSAEAPTTIPVAPETLRIGDPIGGRQINAFVDGTPVCFERRRMGHSFSRSEKQTWAYAYLDGDWKSLGDPWTASRPTNAELAAAIGYVKTVQDVFDGDAMLAEINLQIEAENAGITEATLRQAPIPVEQFRLLELDRNSFEVRFKDQQEPFSVIIENQSPGVYLPKDRNGCGCGSTMSLCNAVKWAVNELSRHQTYRQTALNEKNKDRPRYLVDRDSFMALFGEPRDNTTTVADVRAQFPDEPDQPIFHRDQIKIHPELVLDWIDANTLNVSLQGAAQLLQVQLRAMDYEQAGEGRRLWQAMYALKGATDMIEAELTWSNAKDARAQSGVDLDEVATRYAEFMHSHQPERHDGLVNRMHRQFAMAFADQNVDYMIGWLARPRGQNDLSKKFFTQLTNIKLPKTAKGITVALHGWVGRSPEAAAEIEQEKALRNEQAMLKRQAEETRDRAIRILSNTQVKHLGIIKSAKTFIDDIIESGYDKLETRKVGAVDRYRLVNEAEDRLYEIKGSMVDYARHVLKQRQDAKLSQELQDDEPAPSLRP